MIKNEVDQLLAKYWECDTTLDEELLLRKYFSSDQVDDSHLTFKDMFITLQAQGKPSSKLDIRNIVASQANDVDLSIDTLLDKYWTANTNVEEEKILKEYFLSDQVEDKHTQLKPMFAYYKESSAVRRDINVEEAIKTTPISDKEQKTKVVPMFSQKLQRIAAAVALVAGVSIAFFTLSDIFGPQYKGKYTLLDESKEKEDAMEITQEALALLSSQFGIAQASIQKELKQVDKLDIFIN